MIYVDMKGNLGNQMFIYAFARNIQNITGQQINLSYYNLKKYSKIEDKNMQIFKLNENVIISRKKMPFIANSNILIRRVFNKLIRLNRLKRIIKTIEFNFLKKIGILYWDSEEYKKIDYKKLEKFKNIYIVGYWQSEKYFKNIREILLNEFETKEKIDNINKNMLDNINKGNSICVSIRRGDYISDKKIKKRYYLCDLQYFFQGIDIIKNQNPNARIFCFSDDIEWVKNNIHFKTKSFYENVGTSLNDKINLMKSCDYFVISNSSFSWWIQYLSSNKKNVIAPSRWYSSGIGNDIFQEYWKTIPVGKDRK